MEINMAKLILRMILMHNEAKKEGTLLKAFQEKKLFFPSLNLNRLLDFPLRMMEKDTEMRSSLNPSLKALENN